MLSGHAWRGGVGLCDVEQQMQNSFSSHPLFENGSSPPHPVLPSPPSPCCPPITTPTLHPTQSSRSMFSASVNCQIIIGAHTGPAQRLPPPRPHPPPPQPHPPPPRPPPTRAHPGSTLLYAGISPHFPSVRGSTPHLLCTPPVSFRAELRGFVSPCGIQDTTQLEGEWRGRVIHQCCSLRGCSWFAPCSTAPYTTRVPRRAVVPPCGPLRLIPPCTPCPQIPPSQP